MADFRNKIIGLASSGIHSNGYSLVRKVFFEELEKKPDDFIEDFGCTVGEELLRPTRIYVDSVVNILRHHRINGLVHITGGGFIDNIPRILPVGCVAHIKKDSWPVLPVFTYLQEKGGITVTEMYRTYNMGIGMMAIVSENKVDDLLHQFRAHGEQPYVIGEIRAPQAGNSARVVIDGVC